MGKNFREELNEQLQDLDFKREWDALREEDRLIQRMIEIRKELGLSKKELGKLVGETKKTIKNIENRWISPDVCMFNKILNAMGYELIITNKKDIEEEH